MPFVKGKSGNPGGKPKIPKEVQELARSYTADAIHALASALTNPRERVQAASVLLDRGWGKAPQPMTGANGEGPAKIIHEVLWRGELSTDSTLSNTTPDPSSKPFTNGHSAGQS